MVARKRRLAVYIRTEQAGRDLVDVQLGRVLVWLGLRRSQVRVYWDCCLDYTWPRVGFNRLLIDIRSRRIQTLAVSGFDRLTGNRYALDQFLIFLTHAGISVASYREDKLGEGTGLDRHRVALDRALKWSGA